MRNKIGIKIIGGYVLFVTFILTLSVAGHLATALSTTRNVVIYTVVLMFAAVLFGVIITRRITRPIKELASATQKLAGGDFTARAAIENGDEIGDLADSFNLMAENIQRTTVSKNDLAAKIEERTAELGRLNETLRGEIVERCRTEETLRRREHELSDFLDNGTVALHWIDADGRIMWANKAELNLLGYKNEEYIGRNIAEFHADQNAIKDILERLRNNETLHNYEARLCNRDGSIKYVLINSNVLWENGKFVRTRTFSRDITERKGAEEKLRQSEASYRQLADSMPQIVWTARADGYIEYFNQRWFDYTGMTLEQTEGNGWETVLHPDDLQNCQKVWNEAVATGAQYKVEYRFRRASDGEYRWHLGQALPVRDAENRIVKWYGSCTDIHAQKQVEEELETRVRTRTGELEKTNDDLRDEISERCRAEEKLRQSEQWLRAILDASRDGIVIEDADEIAYINKSYTRLLGYDEPEELVGKQIADILPPTEATRLTEYGLRRRRGEDVPSIYEFTGKRRNGTLVEVEGAVSTSVIGGKTYIMTAIRDITSRKLAEEKLIQLSSIVESSDDAIVSKNLDGVILSWNRGAERLYGYAEHEVLGANIALLIPPGREDEEPRILEKIKSGTSVEHYETVRITKKGDLLDLSLTISPIKNVAGAVIGASKIARDITERKRAEEELKIFAAQLERSNAELQDFASVASHDLQEPLRKVQAFGDRLKAKCSDSLEEDGREYLEKMLSAAGRMKTLINDLLTFSRVASKAQPFAPVNLRRVTDEVLNDLEALIAGTNGTIEIGELGVIEADATQIRQLLQNLIGNALKFSRPGIPPTVKISGHTCEKTFAGSGKKAAMYCLVVQDNGIGFDNKYVDRIFKIFQRLHGRHEYEGTGIGLAVCRRIAERHGGSITAQSAPDAGAIFTLELPAKQSGQNKINIMNF